MNVPERPIAPDPARTLLDAALGTRLISRGLDPARDDPALWNLDHPEQVATIHRLDVDAGAEAILTNTFGANRVWLARFGRARDVVLINQAAAAIARQAAGVGRLVVGDLGPTAGESIIEQAELLVAAGVDALALETFAADNALETLGHLMPRLSVPIVVSLTAWPAAASDLVHRFENLGATAIGLNCVPITVAVEVAARLRAVTTLPLFIKPAGAVPGRPDDDSAVFEAAARDLAAFAPIWLGGCCGSDERHIAAIRRAWYPSAGQS